jgi:peptidoglycan/xylan/chitin deacetylase (PgdA/CDA1 family)
VSYATTVKTAVKSKALRLAGSLSRWSGLVAVNYHRIGDGRQSVLDRGLFSATPEAFDRQLRWLKAHFDVISTRDVILALRAPRGRHVLVTFDDGYSDNHASALPILRSHGVPAVFFVTSGFVGRGRMAWWDEIAWMVRSSRRPGVDLPGWLPAAFPFDEPAREGAVRKLLGVYKGLPVARTDGFLEAIAAATASGRHPGTEASSPWMTWDMVRELRAAGMEVGGHTVSHQVLSRMSPEAQWAEISGCLRRLEQELGVPVRTFSYPVGQRDSFDLATLDGLRRAGVELAFTYHGGHAATGTMDLLTLPRIAVEQEHTFDQFRAAVLAPAFTVTPE